MSTDLAALLRLAELGEGEYENVPLAPGHLYGGWSQALALRAAAATVDPHLPFRASASVFPSAGDAGMPLRIRVQPVRDGRSSAIRQVTVTQHGEVRLLVTASFQAEVAGGEWQAPATALPAGPEQLSTDTSQLVGMDPVEFRPVGNARFDAGAPVMTPPHPFWARPRTTPPDGPGAAAAVLAFVSDYMVVAVSQQPESLLAPGAMTASLDHALWLHRPFDPAAWLLYDAAPLSIAAGRGLVRGTVRDTGGALVASFTQETITLPPRP
ncbi:acyl-CoA thioesterase [Trujillonella humicola]|uniref:acyl-CoA thioesterase n=1 Tax=Trujillonella humicola TaxID=3383699 RepID=UPI0039063636